MFPDSRKLRRYNKEYNTTDTDNVEHFYLSAILVDDVVPWTTGKYEFML